MLQKKWYKSEKGEIVTVVVVSAILGLGAALLWPVAGEAIKAVGTSILCSVGIGITDAIYYIVKAAASFAGTLLMNITTMANLNKPITTNQAFVTAWGNVRDLANMLIVLGFVIVGIATSLRIREYEAKKLLWPLIGVALLINFSGLLCGVIIDASNIVMNTFLANGGSNGIGIKIYNDIMVGVSNVHWDTLAKNCPNGDLGSYIMTEGVFIIMFLITALTLFYLCIVLIARYAVLAVLYILSPMAFAFWIFPATRKFWTKWWEAMVQWAFIGAAGGFFIWVAGSLLNAVNNPSIMDLIPVLIFLFISYKILKAQSGPLGEAVTKLGGAAVGFAMGAATGGASLAFKGVDAMTGGNISGAARKISSGTGRLMESIGLKKQGSTASNAAAGMKDASSRVANMSEADANKAATGRAYTSDAIKVKALATQRAVKEGRLSDLGSTAAEQNTHIASAEGVLKSSGMGSDIRKNAEKLNPNFRRFNQPIIDSKFGGSADAAEADAFQHANVGDIEKYGSETLRSHGFARHTNPKKVSKAAERMSGSQVADVKSNIPHLMTERDDALPSGAHPNPVERQRTEDTLREYNSI